MSSGQNQDQHTDRDLREHIASRLRANEQARRNPVTPQELAQLQSAASRLDQMLKSGANADNEALKSAAARLDQLLTDIGKGKDVSENLKRRQSRQTANP